MGNSLHENYGNFSGCALSPRGRHLLATSKTRRITRDEIKMSGILF